ncbi:MAG TPA: serine hydrolase domain-containing protein [Opitutaceae bacterium]|nr:serine hydrolase domain-containing protein [Opitutaceae bacterium]
MKNSFGPLPGAAFVALLIALPVVRAADGAVNERIARVERGLLPPARIAGAKADIWTVVDRMSVHQVPGLSIAVINDGQIEWARGYGVLRAGEFTAVKSDTLFQAASISKPVAALGALTLVQSGELSLDRDVNEQLKSWKVPVAPAAGGEKVTVRRLLSHTAGLTVHGFSGYAADRPPPTLVQVLNGNDASNAANTAAIRIDLKPGTKWRYSGGGYLVLQQLMLDVSGREFPALMQERVLAPAGMKASTFEQPLPAARASEAAAGHDAEAKPVPGHAHIYPELAAAGLWTTPADLARFVLALQRSLEAKDGLVTQALATEMITPILPDAEYGLGIGVKGAGEKLQLTHGGSNEGFRCMLVFYPRLRRGAVLMTNSDNGNRIITEVLRALAREYEWPDYQVVERPAHSLAPGAFRPFAGRYEREDTTLTFIEREGRYYVQLASGTRVEIFAQSDSEFFSLTSPDIWAFERNSAGEVTHVVRRITAPQIYQRVR